MKIDFFGVVHLRGPYMKMEHDFRRREQLWPAGEKKSALYKKIVFY